MSLILNIDTATARGSISLASGGQLLAAKLNDQQKDHAAWMQVAIQQLMAETGYSLQQLNAVAVVSGPGSYTGLRVGMATAKGLCYACNLPLITLNTLYIMAFAARQQTLSLQNDETSDKKLLFCPMIDARRMEVFTALYNLDLAEIVSPCALVLEPGFFDQWLSEHRILFFGNGSSKCKSLVSHNGRVLDGLYYTPEHVTLLSLIRYRERLFTDIAYSEPAYLKEFHAHHKKEADI